MNCGGGSAETPRSVREMWRFEIDRCFYAERVCQVSNESRGESPSIVQLGEEYGVLGITKLVPDLAAICKRLNVSKA